MMSRRSTLPLEWSPLIRAVGSRAELIEALKVSPSAFDRYARGHRQSDAFYTAVRTLARKHGVSNPLDAVRTVNPDLTDLRMAGLAASKGFPLSPQERERLRGLYPESQLIDLAESDGTPELIMAAVQVLLEP